MDLFPGRNVIQIAGVMDQFEAEMLAQCGVDLLGFPLRIESGEEDLSESDARDVMSRLQRPARGVVITYLEEASAIADLCRRVGTEIIQLHGDVPVAMLEELRESVPGLSVIKSLIVRGDNTAELKDLVDRTRPYVHAYITDTFDATTGRRGATGATHDWSVSRRIVGYSPHPVILAGGLNPDNVARAIRAVRPFGVDAHSGVEDDSGRKSQTLVKNFVLEARKGFESLDKE
ncbi:MAG: phosphoribosylanthranilate isomerase [Candidatus Latescibacterota bacterium]|nr:MAG: phosphoribosylanthranilate isomerase [Candidatus Latescibacterota bacterium]